MFIDLYLLSGVFFCTSENCVRVPERYLSDDNVLGPEEAIMMAEKLDDLFGDDVYPLPNIGWMGNGWKVFYATTSGLHEPDIVKSFKWYLHVEDSKLLSVVLLKI